MLMRIGSVFLTALAFGFGGGLGGLGSGIQRVGKPDPENPVAWVADGSQEQE